MPESPRSTRVTNSVGAALASTSNCRRSFQASAGKNSDGPTDRLSRGRERGSIAQDLASRGRNGPLDLLSLPKTPSEPGFEQLARIAIGAMRPGETGCNLNVKMVGP